MDDLAALSEDQQAALDQYTAVTNQQIEEAIPLLQRTQWNVQIAIARFFDGEPATDPVAEALAQAPPDNRLHETLANGFTTQRTRGPRLPPAPRIVPPPNPDRAYRPGFPFNLILAPFNLVSFLVSRVFRIIGAFLPFVPTFLARLQIQNRNRGSRKPLIPRDNAARFIREFEEEYGTNELPFLEKGYAHSLDEAKRDIKYLLVILLAPEHDDTPDYVKETLLSQDIVSFLRNKESNIIVWGGSVQDSEAYQVSNALGATKFPYAALIAHSPARSSRSGSYATSSGMSIVTTLVGVMPPSEFLSKIRRAMETHTPELSQLRAERAERDAVRNIREEQDTAYERSLARDRERAKQKREDEQRKKQEEEEAAKAEKEQQHAAEQLEDWKYWRAARITPEPSANDKTAIRVSLRLPNGERIVRRFPGEVSVEEIYALVECWECLKEDSISKEAQKPEGFQHVYNFNLVSPMPRVVYDWKDQQSISSKIGRSANLIVEKLVDEDDEDEE